MFKSKAEFNSSKTEIYDACDDRCQEVGAEIET